MQRNIAALVLLVLAVWAVSYFNGCVMVGY